MFVIFQLISADPMTVKLFHEFIAVNALIFFPNLKLLLMKSFYEFVAVNSCLFCALNMEFQRDRDTQLTSGAHTPNIWLMKTCFLSEKSGWFHIDDPALKSWILISRISSTSDDKNICIDYPALESRICLRILQSALFINNGILQLRIGFIN